MVPMDTGPTQRVDHSIVWLAGFVPLLGILLDLWFIQKGISLWWTVVAILAINWIMLEKDKQGLRSRGYVTQPLDSSLWARFLVPAYLFKRVQVAGGGYGYAVLWMATFSIAVLLPILNPTTGSPSLLGASKIEGSCQVGFIEHSCSFTNTGNTADSMCYRVTVTKMNRGASITAQTVCSGQISPRDSVQKPVLFIGEQPAHLCLGEGFLGSWDDCTVSVIID
jgi:hypothetical protein